MTVIYINFSREEMIISFINILKFKKFKTKLSFSFILWLCIILIIYENLFSITS